MFHRMAPSKQASSIQLGDCLLPTPAYSRFGLATRSALAPNDTGPSNQALQPTTGRADIRLFDGFNLQPRGKARSRRWWLSLFSLGLCSLCVTQPLNAR